VADQARGKAKRLKATNRRIYGVGQWELIGGLLLALFC
jgi:hypothetical protein